MADDTPTLISAKEAKELGLKFYFTGKPCSRGHVVKRRVCNLNCSACNDEDGRGWSKENPQKRRQMTATWRSKNLEKCRALLGKFPKPKPIDMSPDKVAQREYFRKWKAANRVRTRVNEHNREARKRGNGGKHSAHDILEIMKLQKKKCAYCKERLTSAYHIDHIEPLFRGGTNHRRNLQILCAHCNLSKRHRDPIVFAQSLGMLL